jgi:hypothetical protein
LAGRLAINQSDFRISAVSTNIKHFTTEPDAMINMFGWPKHRFAFLISDLHICVGCITDLHLFGRTLCRFGGPNGSLVVPIMNRDFRLVSLAAAG